jgi:FkbM family methyltransferase
MLSKKYLAIRSFFSFLSKIAFLHKRLFVFAQMYIDVHKGFRFSYMPDENGEIEFLDALGRLYKDKFIYFDVGAHIGTYTDMVLNRFQKYEGHLFDITKTTLDKCLERHGINQNLTINHAALSDKVGEVEYRSYLNDPSRNGISGVGPEGKLKYKLYKAPSWTGDYYCKKHSIERIHLLKIDAEGYDLHVIKGFNDMLSNGKIDIIQFEYNVKHSETHSMLGDFYRFLEEKDYVIGPIRQEGVMFEPFNFLLNDFNGGPNYVACRSQLKQYLLKF